MLSIFKNYLHDRPAPADKLPIAALDVGGNQKPSYAGRRAGRSTGFLTILITAISSPAAAADPEVKAAAVVAQPPSLNWAGYYFGGHFGAVTGSSRLWSDLAPVGTVGLFHPYDPFKGTGSYDLGLQAGYNWMWSSRLLLGIEADLSAPSTIFGSQQFWTPATGNQAYEDRLRLSGTLRGRIGYAFAPWLPYLTAGFAWGRERISVTPEGATDPSDSAMLSRFGWVAGAGVEYALSERWSARVEYLATDFGRASADLALTGQRIESVLFTQSLRLGFNYRLGEDLTKSDVFTKGVEALDLDRFAVHGQTTFTWQYAAPFRAPYAGQNSLAPNHGRETWDATLFVGARLWDGAEFWFTPEIDQGFGLSGTFGLAGFPSGEAYKVGSDLPYARLPRYFIRQTIDLGGAVQSVDSGLMQFAGKQTSDRLVITAGKFSFTDIFDTNKFAHDPRSDFLNWGLADTASLDYPADAWAFTYGVAAEWYQGPWTFRAGVMDLPTVPNGPNLDPKFGQFALIGEIERRYNLWGLAGKVAITGFLDRQRLGRFDEAVALGLATGATPSTADVRRYTSKNGYSINLEQQVTDDIGLFARAGYSSPNIETSAFTDVDTTFAAGAQLAGRLWGRAEDVVGIAGLVNHISATRIAYFNAGGLSPIIGDGRLPNPGNETIIEAYYNLPLYTWRLTADYQFVVNPAYNRDRGPVSIFATRLHTQF